MPALSLAPELPPEPLVALLPPVSLSPASPKLMPAVPEPAAPPPWDSGGGRPVDLQLFEIVISQFCGALRPRPATLAKRDGGTPLHE
jgi:hypothetical protein